MATKIKDSATAERAAMNVNKGIEVPATGEPNAPKEKTTSERLFPEFVTSDGAIVNRPIPQEPSVPAKVAETPAPAFQGQTSPTQAPTAPTYLKPDELAGKMVKLKVDGIEQDVPASELIKLTQLERHSNAQLMKIAQDRAQLERDRQELMSRPVMPEPKTPKQPEVKKTPEIEALEMKLAQMEQAMAQERALLQPQIQEAGIKRVEQMAKERIGADDFRSYFDRVREVALSKAQEAQLRGDPNWKQYDTDGFYFETYKEMKLKEMLSKPVNPNPSNAPVLQTQTGAPVVVNNNGQPVSIPSFESSSGVPARTSPTADWQATYNRLLKTAQSEPTNENWMAVMRHKYTAGQ